VNINLGTFFVVFYYLNVFTLLFLAHSLYIAYIIFSTNIIMSGSYYTLNSKYNQLLALIQKYIAAPGTQDLASVLALGNSAGAFDIDLNSNDITNVSLINGSPYPPAAPATPALSAVLTAGDNAGGLDITGLNNLDVTTINGSAYPPVVPADDLQAVLTAGNTATGANANITLSDSAAKLTIVNSSVGGIANPLLLLQNDNTTAGGTTIETYKNDTPTTTGGDVVGIWSATCNTNVGKTEIARISQIAYGVGASNNDGGIVLACKVNSSLAPTNFLACNGGAGAGEVQIFRPITNPTGNIELTTTNSTGAGDIILTPKLNGDIILAGGGGGGNSGVISATTSNGNISLTTTGLGQVAVYSETTQTITGKQGLTLQTIVAGADISITTGLTGATGDISLKSGLLLLDSDDLRLTNSSTAVGSGANTSSLSTTSAIGDITNYLKVKLNGADIWLPYFTTNPST
jgi:hypothetical protein